MPFRLVPARDRKLFRLVKKTEPVRVPKGRRLYAPGEPAREVFLVRTGHVRLVLPGLERGHAERTVAVALPWELFGDEALSGAGGLRRYGAYVGASSTLHALPAAQVLAALKTARGSLDGYLEGVERELLRLRHAQSGSHGPSVAQRLAEVLLDLGERCGEPEGRGLHLGVRLTHRVLADLSGAHRATVTMLLNDWMYAGVLGADREGRLVLQRPWELWALAGYHTSTETSSAASAR
ncbi:MAG TPA: Crp/Fnr family transcriptional regulator [Longimicrobiales bacterium]|nr:Crp/Fnr family transcriptional regulator [Longimicrobiales bacterium]